LSGEFKVPSTVPYRRNGTVHDGDGDGGSDREAICLLFATRPEKRNWDETGAYLGALPCP
jgi:hypothetical protein